jgi:hypothetical protein
MWTVYIRSQQKRFINGCRWMDSWQQGGGMIRPCSSNSARRFPLISTAFSILWRAWNLTSFSPCLTGPVDYLFASRHKGPGFKYPGGYLCGTGILLLALSRYIGDPDLIDNFCGLVCGRLHPKPSLGPRADNVISPLDLTQLYCPGFTLAAGPLPTSQLTESAAGGEPCAESAISLHSHHVSLVQWTTHLHHVTRDPRSNPQGGSYLEPGFSC